MGHVRNETSGAGPGLGRHRDGFRTEHGMSHNTVPTESGKDFLVGNNMGAGIPHRIGVRDVQGMGAGQCLGSHLPPSIPAL